jgi:hypothetical protein
MVRADCIPTEYRCLKQPEASEFFSSNQAYSVPTTFCLATEATGWRPIRYDANSQRAEDEADVQDSLEALKEPQGIRIEDLRRELDV